MSAPLSDPKLDPKQIFLDALELDSPEALQRYVDEACGGNFELRSRVEALLRVNGEVGNFLGGPPSQVATIDQTVLERHGTQIGRYKLLEQVGEGGMGVVYVAEQTEPIRRRVALKIIKPGMDSKQVIARFEAERQALAMMDHPNIAKVLDAGSTDAGRPYFVMELVRGMPITDYCDKVRLSPHQRLELLADVCRAVQHAHQKGIIHRDLKPSNVLVTLHDGTPVAKVIDFGIAKAVGQQLSERTVYTALTQLVGTPLYMSPEQAEMSGLDVDTRSDVYSLGVLLYELLTGRTPFDKEMLAQAGLDEMRRIIREDEPPRPSHRFSTLGAAAISTVSQHRGVDERRLSRILRGELDWIAMKALEKDRRRRYESAESLAADLQRYLSDEPVLACPPSTMYRFQKFARKHKPALATASALAACLILGTTVSAWQAVRATTAEAQATANEAQAQANAKQAAEKAKEATVQRDDAQKQRDEVQALNEKLAAKEQQLRQTLYAARMNLAQHAAAEGAFSRAESLLNRLRPKPGEADLRNFEWHYLRRLCPLDLLTLRGHTANITRVVYSPDGKRLATACADGTVKVWDSTSGRELLSLPGHRFQATSVAFSPDSSRLASTSRDGTAKLWDARTGKEIASVALDSGLLRALVEAQTAGEDAASVQSHPFFDVIFSPDGKQLATGSIGSISLWDAQTFEPVRMIRGVGISTFSLAFSPDGKLLASGSSNKTVKLWAVESGDVVHTLQGHTLDVLQVAFSTDGKRVVSKAGSRSEPDEFRVWDLETGLEVKATAEDLLALDRGRTSLDGKRIAVREGKTVGIRDAQPVRSSLTIGGLTNATIMSIAFSPDGRRLATVSPATDPSGGETKIWNAWTGAELLTLKIESVRNVSFSPDGNRVATVSGGRPGDELNVFDAHSGQRLLTFAASSRAMFRGFMSGGTFSPDGKLLVGAMTTIELPAFGKRRPMDVKVWDTIDGRELLTIPQLNLQPRSFAFSPNGKWLAAQCGASPEDGGPVVKVWESDTGRELLTLPAVEDKVPFVAYTSVAFTSDGKRLASGGKVWDAATGQELVTLEGASGNIAFSPDNQRLVSAGSDGKVKVWDSQAGDLLLTLEGHSRWNPVRFSPDGRRLAAANAQGGVTIYEAAPLAHP